MNTQDSHPHLRTRWLLAGLLVLGSTAWSTDSPTLKDAYKDHFMVGTAINRSMTTGAGSRRGAEQVSQDIALIKQQFNQVSPENDLKWEIIQPRPGPDGFDFGPADAFVNFGLSNNMYLVGHTLVWHSQTPNWVFQGTNAPPQTSSADSTLRAAATNAPGRGRFGGGFPGRFTGPRASREELLERMREHIHTVVGRYKGKIKVKGEGRTQSFCICSFSCFFV